ncbi:MAG: Hsp20/alpha crystallin family protein [bacterium]
MTLVKYRPFRSLLSFDDEMRRFLNLGDYESDTVWRPNVDIIDNEDSYELKAELPGLKKKDIDISVEDGILKLKGEKKTEDEKKEKNYHLRESYYGKFERSFRLPRDVEHDKIKAEFNDGVLDIQIPKSEKAKPKQISVS